MGYMELAKVFATHHVDIDFTCMEMRDQEQDRSARSMPEELVDQVANAAASAGVRLSGENALPRYDQTAYDQILKYRPRLAAFTYLRLSDQLLGEGFDAFASFV